MFFIALFKIFLVFLQVPVEGVCRHIFGAALYSGLYGISI